MTGRSCRTAGAISMLAICAASTQALGADYIKCDGSAHGLQFWSDGSNKVSWMTKIDVEGSPYSYCSYVEGIDIPLKALNDWSVDVSGQNVLIFHGYGNHCSAGEFLLFDQRSKAVLIVHSDFSTEKHQCE